MRRAARLRPLFPLVALGALLARAALGATSGHTAIDMLPVLEALALILVLAPMLLGLGVSEWFLERHNVLAHWFVGATLAATSVGITARVLTDLGRSASLEGRIILGAAVIDDVLGLLVLAVVTGLIQAAG